MSLGSKGQAIVQSNSSSRNCYCELIALVDAVDFYVDVQYGPKTGATGAGLKQPRGYNGSCRMALALGCVDCR